MALYKYAHYYNIIIIFVMSGVLYCKYKRAWEESSDRQTAVILICAMQAFTKYCKIEVYINNTRREKCCG